MESSSKEQKVEIHWHHLKGLFWFEGDTQPMDLPYFCLFMMPNYDVY